MRTSSGPPGEVKTRTPRSAFAHAYRLDQTLRTNHTMSRMTRIVPNMPPPMYTPFSIDRNNVFGHEQRWSVGSLPHRNRASSTRYRREDAEICWAPNELAVIRQPQARPVTFGPIE
jgi:hypothetical protein